MRYLRKLAASFAAKKKRLAEVATGHGGKLVEEWLFDTFLYGAVSIFCQQQWGIFYGAIATFLIMAPLSALVCSLYLKFYDWLGRDIFAFESIKESEEIAEGGWVYRYIIPLIKKGDVAAFFILSIFKDPFMTVVYLRDKDRKYQGLGPREKRIFWSSVVVSNAYWAFRWNILVIVITKVWQQL